MAKEPEDTELLQTGYPSDGISVMIVDQAGTRGASFWADQSTLGRSRGRNIVATLVCKYLISLIIFSLTKACLYGGSGTQRRAPPPLQWQFLSPAPRAPGRDKGKPSQGPGYALY